MSEVFDPAGLQMLLGDTEYSLTRGGPEEGDRDRGSQRFGAATLVEARRTTSARRALAIVELIEDRLKR